MPSIALGLVEALAPCPHAFDKPGILQHPKVLADRLPREIRTFREFGDRLPRPAILRHLTASLFSLGERN
jgi:hypothetical protein